jgi:hypothetical protein
MGEARGVVALAHSAMRRCAPYVMETRRTAWHYFLDILLREQGSRSFEYLAEEPLTKALQHMDWLVLQRRDDTPFAPGTTLVRLWALLTAVTILEYKSAKEGYRTRGLDRLLGYAHQYLYANPERVPARNDLTLVLMVAQRNEALDADLRELTLHEEPIAPGYARLHGAAFSLLLVDLTELARHKRDDFIAIFAAGIEPSAAATSWWYAHRGIKDKAMDPTQLEGFDDLNRRFLESFSPKERLAGLAPEERLADLPPEQTILALPDAMLARLPEAFLATLPADVQAAVRARLAR